MSMQPIMQPSSLIYLVCIAALANAVLPEHSSTGNTLETAQILCATHRSTPTNVEEQLDNDDADGNAIFLDDAGFQRCENDNRHCFTFWSEDPSNGTITIHEQGCWISSGEAHDCQTSCVSELRQTKAMDNRNFCCCTGNLCNLNFTYIPSNATPSTGPPSTEVMPTNSMLPYIWVAACITLILLIAFPVCVWRLRPAKCDLEMGGQGQAIPPPEYNLNKLCLFEMIGQGRYGSVWRGALDDQNVAVKIFPAHHRNYFLNEHELYKEAGENSALVTCFGGGERCITPNGIPDYLLILGLEQESLQDYLRKRTLDLSTLCRMSLGVAKGLAHLHSDLGKSCIAHRDLNTRNILVRDDLTCCICDLGLAVIPRRTENRSLSEAGTLRYMAPEVLEGAVNLRDCESALKQIDVYALGLVLWEMGVRCTDLQNSEPSSYSPPFYKEIGDNPSLEQMQTLVSRHKARPLWPAGWKDTPSARLLAETAEDCWDQDAEARLTSLCVEERLLDLPTLKPRSLTTHFIAPTSPLHHQRINNNHLRDANIDASVGTIETLLSPSEEYCKNSNQLATCVIPLQPHQGRNPCMERNLLAGSSDSLLVDKSAKHCIAASESQNLLCNDFLRLQTRAMPIPYLQNAVHAMPKHNNTEICSVPPRSKFKWSGRLKKMFKSGGERKETQVCLVTGKLVNGQATTTSILNQQRPSTLPLISNNANTAGISQLLAHGDNLARQRSLEQFSEVFSSTSDLSRLKNPSERVKTPGDVPPSVRRTRGKAAKESATRFSLYDDRMMMSASWGSVPDLEPALEKKKPPQLHQVQDCGSVSSF